MTGPANPFAFPAPDDDRPSDGYGMTLRDHFAGQLAAAEVSSAGMNRHAAAALADAAMRAGQTIPQRIAFNAYQIADAMLAERERT